MYSQLRPLHSLLFAAWIVGSVNAATPVTKPAQPLTELLEEAPIEASTDLSKSEAREPTQGLASNVNKSESCTAGIGKLFGASSHHYTLANMKNWTNHFLSIAFTNVNHTEIDSVRVHTTSRTPNYYNGNGGTFRLHIYSDDGNGKPGSSVGQTPNYIGATSLKATSGPWSSRSQAESTYPDAIWSTHGESGKHLEYHRRFDLTTPLSVTPGTRYHIVMERTSPIAHGTSLNGHFTGRLDKEDDPTFHPGDWRIHTSSNGTSWNKINHIGIFEVFGDGMTIGNAQHEIAAYSDSDRSNNINGTSAARQVWVPHKTMEIARLRVQAGRRSGSAPLNYEIKDSNGAVLRSGSISGYPVLSSGNDIRETVKQMERKSADFPPLQVVAGETFYIELKTVKGTHYEIGMTRDGVLSGYYNIDPEYHGWGRNSTAEVSYNNGTSWTQPSNWGNPQKYLAIEADVGEYADGISTCLENQ